MGKNNKNFNLITSAKNYLLDKRNLPLFFMLIIYSYFLLPLCFINNDYFNLLAAFHIDSGSILGSIFTIMNKNIFYNQNKGFHTAVYGYPYNSLLFIVFVLIRKIFHLSVVNDFPIFAIVARLISFLISVITVSLIYLLSLKILKKAFFAFFVVILLAVFPGFSFYSSLIKPDILALFFVSLSFLLIYLYIDENKSFYYISAIVFAALATFTKQQYIFIGAPLVLAYFINRRLNNNFIKDLQILLLYYLKAAIIIFPLFFLIHPFAFIDFPHFIASQKILSGNISAPIIENVRFWLSLYVQYPIILLGFFSSFITIVYFHFNKIKSVAFKIVFLLSFFSIIYTLWLTASVGPIRVEAYLIPVFSFYTINIFYLFLQVNSINNKSKLLNIFKIFLFFILFTIFTFSFKLMLKNTISLISLSYNFKKSIQVYAVGHLMLKSPIQQQFSKTKIIFTASLPVPQYKFKDAKNIWQFNFGDKFISEIKAYNPDYIAVDTTQYYEQSYTWWKKTALNLGFTKEKVYLKDKVIEENKLKENETKSVVVIFYK